MTHTHAILELSQAAYQEIRRKLEAAGYQHSFLDDPEGERIDMHGIALRACAASTQDGQFNPEHPINACCLSPEMSECCYYRSGHTGKHEWEERADADEFRALPHDALMRGADPIRPG
jgi:hypothetical protein